MATCAPSLMPNVRSQWIFYISSAMKKSSIRQTSTCSISRQYGVLILMRHMRAMHVSILTIGRTSVASRSIWIMKGSSAASGRPSTSSNGTLTAAAMSTGAATRTGGRSRNIIRSTTKYMPADRMKAASNPTVPTSIVKLIVVQPSDPSSSSSLATEKGPAKVSTKHTKACFWVKCLPAPLSCMVVGLKVYPLWIHVLS